MGGSEAYFASHEATPDKTMNTEDRFTSLCGLYADVFEDMIVVHDNVVGRYAVVTEDVEQWLNAVANAPREPNLSAYDLYNDFCQCCDVVQDVEVGVRYFLATGTHLGHGSGAILRDDLRLALDRGEHVFAVCGPNNSFVDYYPGADENTAVIAAVADAGADDSSVEGMTAHRIE